MIFSEIGPNAVIDYSSDLRSRDMDQNHDWINDAQQHYSSTDLENANIFVHQASSNGWDNPKVENNLVDYQTLNEKQKIVFKRIESHYHNILMGHQVEPLRIIIMGTAGTGKSYLIEVIRD